MSDDTYNSITEIFGQHRHNYVPLASGVELTTGAVILTCFCGDVIRVKPRELEAKPDYLSIGETSTKPVQA